MRDRRLTPARPDLAATRLEGVVKAARYVAPEARQVRAAALPLRRAPAAEAPLDTQLLYGEIFDLYEEKDGWAWGQAALDGYVGYAPAGGLARPILPPSHRVASLRSYIFSKPDIKSPPRALVSMNAQLCARPHDETFLELQSGGFIFAGHCAPIEEHTDDYAGVAERFAGAPYLWGGRESLGLDCSGLVQTVLLRAGLACPRDADQQAEALGRDAADGAIGTGDGFAFRRGDLVFWKGHVGVMRDAETLIHANAVAMQTTCDPVREFAAGVLARAGPIICVKRIDLPAARVKSAS